MPQVNSDILRWARETAGLTVPEAVGRSEVVSRNTVNNDLGAVSILASYAVHRGWISERPRIKRSAHTVRVKWLEAQDVKAYLKALRAEYRTQQVLLLSTGLRLGESEGLRVLDVRDGSRGMRLSVMDSKTEHGVRTVYVPPWAADALREHISEKGMSGTDRIFTLKRRAVQAEHDRACEESGIPEYTIHDHRHSAAVALARAGMPLHLLQKQLGHKNIEMTMRYASFHPDYNDVAGYFEGMGDLLGFTDSAQSGSNGQGTLRGTPAKVEHHTEAAIMA